MNTIFIGVRDFRQNISTYAKKARSASERLVVVSHNKPLFEIKPFSEDTSLSTLFAEINKAKKDIEEGNYHTHDEILKELA